MLFSTACRGCPSMVQRAITVKSPHLVSGGRMLSTGSKTPAKQWQPYRYLKDGRRNMMFFFFAEHDLPPKACQTRNIPRSECGGVETCGKYSLIRTFGWPPAVRNASEKCDTYLHLTCYMFDSSPSTCHPSTEVSDSPPLLQGWSCHHETQASGMCQSILFVIFVVHRKSCFPHAC